MQGVRRGEIWVIDLGLAQKTRPCRRTRRAQDHGAGWGVQVGPLHRGPSGVQSSLSMHIQRTFMPGSQA